MNTFKAIACKEGSTKLPDSVALMTWGFDPIFGNLEIVAQKVRFLTGELFRYVEYDLLTTGILQESVGVVKLEIDETKDYVTIESLNNRSYNSESGRSLIKRVGSAGLELAFRVSHLVGRAGKIQLLTSKDASLFYFSWGFRFLPDPKLEERLSQLSIRDIASFSESEHEPEINTPFTVEDLTLYARLVLGREPKDLEESLQCIRLQKKDHIMDLILQWKRTPREGISLSNWFRSKMYLPDEVIEKKRRHYALINI